MSDNVDEFLAHYGVIGMHWGVRKSENGTRTTKSTQDKRQIRREKAVRTYERRAATYKNEIDELSRKRGSNWFTQRSMDQQIKDLSKLRDIASKDVELKKQGKLSTGQKKILIGAAVVASIIAADLTCKGIQSGMSNQVLMKGKTFIEGKDTPTWKKNADLSGKDLDFKTIKSLVVDHINPDFGELGTKANCRRCTFAYEMRRRGNDVNATRTTNGLGQNVSGLINAISPGKQLTPSSFIGMTSRGAIEAVRKSMDESVKTPIMDILDLKTHQTLFGKIKVERTGGYAKNIFDSLSSFPSGARGELGASYNMGGAHSLAWEIIKDKPVIFDTQSGMVYKSADDLSGLSSNFDKVGITRLDDIDLNEDFLMRWLKNA